MEEQASPCHLENICLQTLLQTHILTNSNSSNRNTNLKFSILKHSLLDLMTYCKDTTTLLKKIKISKVRFRRQTSNFLSTKALQASFKIAETQGLEIHNHYRLVQESQQGNQYNSYLKESMKNWHNSGLSLKIMAKQINQLQSLKSAADN